MDDNTYDLIKILDKLLSENSLKKLAFDLNVATGTIKRWKELNNVPSSYCFQLLTLCKIDINYDNFTFKEKDQFFTSTNTAKYCFDKLNEVLKIYSKQIDNYIFIEPSAGNGRFTEILPKGKSISIDIEPRNENIIKADYLNWFPSDKNKSYVVIGNPPFGLRGQLALKFINHSYDFADYIGFILPQLFESDGKGSPRKRIKNYNLIHSEKLNTQFEDPDGKKIKVECIFQIWSKFDKNEKYEILENKQENIKVYSLSDGGTSSTTRNKKMHTSCDIYLPSTCFGKENMKFYDKFEDLPSRKGYGIVFLQNKEYYLDKFKTANWGDISFLSTNSAFNIRSSQIINYLLR